MNRRNNLAIVLTTTMMTFMLTACGNTQDNAKVESTNTIAAHIAEEPTTLESTIPSAETYVDESLGIIISKEIGVHKENDVSIYPVIEWVPFSEEQEVGQYTNSDSVNADLFVHGFKEVTLDETSIAPGKIENIEYAFDGSRAQMRFTYVTENASSVWELHAENTGKELDISDIGNAEPSTFFGPKKLNGMIISNYLSYFEAENGDIHSVDVYLAYSPTTGNMYSLHSVMPDGPSPSIFFYDDNYYPNAFINPTSDEIISEFVMVMGEKEKTYPFRVGMRFGEWANSQYNIDGWHTTSDGLVVSPDNEYFVCDVEFILPPVKAYPMG